jgi:aromatic ring-cleaving dioxygenase
MSDIVVRSFGMKLIVKNSNLIDSRRKCRRDGLVSVKFMKGFLRLLFLACLVVGTTSADAENSPVTSVRTRLTFAVADFDGDLRPDLADVQIGQSSVSLTDYWVQFRLTAAERQMILVVAPSGGLEIAARDVNGDHAVDLVLTTVWLGRPVAILLNDGHGRFSEVDPSGFPEAFNECQQRWQSSTQLPPSGALGSPPQSRYGISSAVACIQRLWPSVGAISHASCGFLSSPFLNACRGRAPPFEVIHL